MCRSFQINGNYSLLLSFRQILGASRLDKGFTSFKTKINSQQWTCCYSSSEECFLFSFKQIIEVLYWCFTEVIVKYTNHNFFLCQQNAVRHTLSLRKRFVRVPDPKRPYKSMWTISSDYQRNHLKEKRSQLERKNSLKNKNVSDKESDQMAQSMDFETTSEFSGSCASPNQSQDGF